MDDIRWKQRFQNFDKAYGTFCRTLERYRVNRDDEVVKMALVKSFEFTYELAWKTMKDYLEAEGAGTARGSREAIRFGFQAALLRDEAEAEKWQETVDIRNKMSHDYNQTLVDSAVVFVEGTFFPLVARLHEVLGARCSA
jgi:nucleotidyltransferase substrate binding protein (TIGR01987 family)